MEPNFPAQTAFDRMVTTEQNQILKASLPYLPPSGQRALSVYTKFMELSNTLSLFPSSQESMRICAEPGEPFSPLSFLQEIRKYADGPTGNKIDGLLHMMMMVQMLQIINEPESGE